MVSRIEPDRYADTGFSVKDTAPEINEMIFHRVMARSAGERLLMGLEMTATSRALVWASLPSGLGASERRSAFYERFYGEPCPVGC
jgi:hypothetical protein